MKAISRLIGISALVLGIAAAATAATTLYAGAKAPPLKVAKWLKGTPIRNFEKGKVYVVEFWATWCGPCKQSIPHLTELAKKYAGKVTFTGVDVYEVPQPKDESYIPKVAQFVKDFGKKMDYNVAADGQGMTMAHTWMEAAGQNGIPTAFVVDQSSKVVWIGHPMAGLDETLSQVVAGKFDVKAEAAKEAKAREAGDAQMAAMNSFMKPLRAKDYKGAVAAMDKLIAATPSMELQLGAMRFMALSHYDMPAATAYAQKLSSGTYKGQPSMLNQLAWSMVDDENPLEGSDPKVAVAIAEEAVAALKDNDPQAAYIYDTLAYSYYKNGQLDKAIQTGSKAVEISDKTSGFDATVKKEIVGHLALYKQKKGAGL